MIQFFHWCVDNRTKSLLDWKKCIVIVAKKWGKPLAGYDMCGNLLKEEIWVDHLLVDKDFLLGKSVSFYEGVEIFYRD